MDDRLPAHLEAAGLRRAAETVGGHATILARGDADRGSLVLLILERGQAHSVVERQLGGGGDYRWQTVSSAPISDSLALDQWCAKRRRSDPDLWLIELDVPHGERFIVENSLSG